MGRYGGYEFLIILLEFNKKEGEFLNDHAKKYNHIRQLIEDNTGEVLKKIKNDINKTDIKVGSAKLKITITLGFSIFHSSVNFFDDMFSKADKALYSAKQKGRNCIAYSFDNDIHVLNDAEKNIC